MVKLIGFLGIVASAMMTSSGCRKTTSQVQGSTPNEPTVVAVDLPATPSPVTGLTSSVTSSTVLALSWTNPSSAYSNIEIETCSGAACTSFAAVSGSPFASGTTSFNMTTLTPGSIYNARVRTVSTNSAGSTASSWVTLGSTTMPGAPAAPTGFTVTVNNGSQATLNWTNPGGTFNGIQVQSCSGAGCSSFADVSGSPFSNTTTSSVQSGLTTGASMNFRIRSSRTVGTDTLTSAWVTSGATTITPTQNACASPVTRIVDAGTKSTATANTIRAQWSDVRTIPSANSSYANQPAVAYIDSGAGGTTGNQVVKLAYRVGNTWRVEVVGGDTFATVSGSGAWIRLAFLGQSPNQGIPMVFWTNGTSSVKVARRSAALTSTGAWSVANLDNSNVAVRALEVSVSPIDDVAVFYLSDTAATGRARFAYCAAPCNALSDFQAMTSAATTANIENTNLIAATAVVGVDWCQTSAGVYRPAVTYTNTGNTRYAVCTGALSTCLANTGWSGTSVIGAAAGISTRVVTDRSTVNGKAWVLASNAGNTLKLIYESSGTCAAPSTWTAGANTFASGTIGSVMMDFHRDQYGFFHVIANNAATAINYFNSTSNIATTTAWNTAHTVETIAIQAINAGRFGSALDTTNARLHISYAPTNAAPSNLNLNLATINDYTVASASQPVPTYSTPDTTGGVMLQTATGQVRNIAVATTANGTPGLAYVDYSGGTAASGLLKYVLRNGSSASTATYLPQIVYGAGAPSAPGLAYDSSDLPWVSYFDSSIMKFLLSKNTSADGTGSWVQYHFPLTGKTAAGTAPAVDDSAVGMITVSSVQYPIMVVNNGTANGGGGVRAARFDTSTLSFSVPATIETLAGSFGGRLSMATSTFGAHVAYYDLTNFRVRFSQSPDGLVWNNNLGSITVATLANVNQGQGISVAINPATGLPGISYLDRANNTLFYTACTASSAAGCSSAVNWSAPTAVETGLGYNQFAAGGAVDQLLQTALTFTAAGAPFINYFRGSLATTPGLSLYTNLGSWSSTALLDSVGIANNPGASNTVTAVTVAAPGVLTAATHGLVIGDPVALAQQSAAGALPTGLSFDTPYFVCTVPSANTFSLATSLANALAGTCITTTGGAWAATVNLVRLAPNNLTYSQAGFGVRAVRSAFTGSLHTSYIGPGNYLYMTSCGN